MHSLYACVVNGHDLRVVLLAAVICVVGVYATFSLATFAYFTKSRRERQVWAAAAVFTSATSTWATHFVAMLAFHPGAPSGFDPVLTVTSFLVAVLVIGIGIALAVFAAGPAQRAFGGCTVGLGISAMHYIGMAAYLVPGTVSWNAVAIAASVLLSVQFGCLGALAAFSRERWWRQAAPPAMILSICSLHFVGMSAMEIHYDPTRVLSTGVVDRVQLLIVVAGAALLIVAAGLAGLVLQLISRRRRGAERRRLGDLADIALEGLLICDGEEVISANRSAARLCGVEPEELRGLRVPDLLGGAQAAAISEVAEDETMLLGEHGRIPVRVLRRRIEIEGRTHAVIAVRDQRERLRVEAHIRDLAFTDSLTGLPNRARFTAQLEERSGTQRGGDADRAILMIDLDRFKLVNDTLGHQAGDQVLRQAAGRLRAAVRDDDLVARLGGDEFAVLQRGIRDAGQARAVAGRIVEFMSRPFLIDGQIVNIGASVGVPLAPQDGETAEELLRNADLAAYNAKGAGRGTFRMFEAALDEKMQRRRALERDLRRAVARQEFQLHYQPLIDIKTGRMTGAEALIRWNDPERGLISPSEFIPLAEETGLIANIGQWTLRTACIEAMSWPAYMSVAVNLSPVQFRDPKLAEMVKGVLAATGLASERLELEITEGVLIADEERTLDILKQLRSYGVRISMDDFGTGYSSLSYLRRFPFDKIKVDRSFMSRIPDDQESASIVRAIITMGSCLGLTTLVEGVETPEQMAFTSAEGCDQVQGFLLSHPLTADKLAEFIAEVREAA